VIITRSWAMPSADTLTVKPIKAYFEKYKFGVTVDPFARNCELCEITNDLNPDTKAIYHLKACDFLREIPQMNFVLFDPPYTIRKVKELYQSIGLEFMKYESQNSIRWTTERGIIASKQNAGDMVMSLGYSSVCMGKKRGYEILEVGLIAHGPAHSDTIITIERKTS
jgi:16S rRNA G966 N2-methylase RsmD